MPAVIICRVTPFIVPKEFHSDKELRTVSLLAWQSPLGEVYINNGVVIRSSPSELPSVDFGARWPRRLQLQLLPNHESRMQHAGSQNGSVRVSVSPQPSPRAVFGRKATLFP